MDVAKALQNSSKGQLKYDGKWLEKGQLEVRR